MLISEYAGYLTTMQIVQTKKNAIRLIAINLFMKFLNNRKRSGQIKEIHGHK